MSVPAICDVAVVGGGPAGSTTATFLAHAGLHVVLFERQVFPRFHVGESLLPATLPVLDRLRVHDEVKAHGFQIKHGAIFTDQEMQLEHRFYFLHGKPWPANAYEVPRADFDALLLRHSGKSGVDVRQPATVKTLAFDADGATITGESVEGPFTMRARFVVDASGRDSVIASRLGRRDRIPNLGKVALVAHWRGGTRETGKDEGSIQIHVHPDGWFWYIPFSNGVTSVGAVMHARTVRAWAGTQEDLYAEMVRRCVRVRTNLAVAERITPVHSEANFSYKNRPAIGDRFLSVGDSVTFIDPIFSAGVHIAMSSGEMAANAIVRAFREQRFKKSQFRSYERAVWRGVAPIFKFIHKYYEPAFLELFLKPRNELGMRDAVIEVLSGGAFFGMGPKMRLALAIVFAAARGNVWVRRRAGRPVESRLEW